MAGGTAVVTGGELVIHGGDGWNAVKRAFSGDEWGNAFQANGIVYFASCTLNYYHIF